MVLYDKHIYHHNLRHEGITFVNVGGFSADVVDKIRQELVGTSGDVIVIFGTATMMLPQTWAKRSVEELDQQPFIGKFALVMGEEYLRFLPDFKEVPKLVGCFTSPEDALAAMRPGLDIRDIDITDKAGESTRRSRKPPRTGRQRPNLASDNGSEPPSRPR